MKFRKKPVVIEAITFAELIEHGKANGANIVNGMPWSFSYAGHPVTHENDDCYLIPTLEGTMKMGRDDMLITGVKGEIYPCKLDIFAATYEPTDGLASSPSQPAVRDVIAERQRQISAEGWTPEHDDEHTGAELVFAAISYALPEEERGSKTVIDHEEWSGGARHHDSKLMPVGRAQVPVMWPVSWLGCYWKPKNCRADLVRAGALILAEIERLDRAAAPALGEGER